MAAASLLPLPKSVFYDSNGNPLAGGFVYTYVPGGSVPKTTWQDATQSVVNSNPITLDADGACLLYGNGAYQVTVTDSLGNSVPSYTGLTVSAPISTAMAGVLGQPTLTAAAFAFGVPSVFASFATLKANTTSASGGAIVYVEGSVNPGDGGQSNYVYVSTDLSTANNDWEVLVDTLNQRWYRELNQSGGSFTGAGKTLALSDGNQVIFRKNSGTLMVDTLPGTGNFLPAGWRTKIKNTDATAMYVLQTAAGASLDGVSGALAFIGPSQSLDIYSQGAGSFQSLEKAARTVCGANLAVYVNGATGNDAFHGLSSGTPLATIGKATAIVYDLFDHAGFTPTIHIANGSYTTSTNVVGNPTGAPQLVYSGNGLGNTGVNVSNNPAFVAGLGANLLLQDLTVSATGAPGDYVVGGVGMVAYNGGVINFQRVAFGACSVAHTASTAGATVSSLGQPYTINGNSPYHMAVNQCGAAIFADSAVTLTGTPAFTAFAAVNGNALLYAPSMTFSGSATGDRYAVSGGGGIETNGGGATYFPGNSPGVNDGTGFYT